MAMGKDSNQRITCGLSPMNMMVFTGETKNLAREDFCTEPLLFLCWTSADSLPAPAVHFFIVVVLPEANVHKIRYTTFRTDGYTQSYGSNYLSSEHSPKP